MKRKYFTYAVIPVLALLFVGTGIASAHGWFSGYTNASPEELAKHYQAMLTNEAAIVGMTETEYKEAWSQGKTLFDIAKEKGISDADLKTKLQAAHQTKIKEQLQSLVTQGVLTQTQADKRFEFMKTKMNGKMMRGMLRGGHVPF